jgi:gas vesicle protein
MSRLCGVRSQLRSHLGGISMKFVVGFLSGLVLGAVGAVAYSVQSGRDLREAFDEVRSDLNKRDLEALGSRLEARFAEMQAQLESRIGQVRERATTAVDGAAETAQAAAEDAAETAQAAVEEQAGA